MTNKTTTTPVRTIGRAHLKALEDRLSANDKRFAEDLSPDGVAKALNQLASVLAGRELAIRTNHLIDDPFERIGEMQCATADELVPAATAGDTKALGQAQRKLQSLSSLETLATVIRMATDWDAIEQYHQNAKRQTALSLLELQKQINQP